jgi:hypothetical protein
VENANWKYVLVNMFVKPQPLKMLTHWYSQKILMINFTMLENMLWDYMHSGLCF